MTIFFDSPVWKKSVSGRKLYSHLVSDKSHTELHEFALKAGIKRHFFHSSARIAHYDITAEQIETVKKFGAFEVSSKELVKLARYVK